MVFSAERAIPGLISTRKPRVPGVPSAGMPNLFAISPPLAYRFDHGETPRSAFTDLCSEAVAGGGHSAGRGRGRFQYRLYAGHGRAGKIGGDRHIQIHGVIVIVCTIQGWVLVQNKSN